MILFLHLLLFPLKIRTNGGSAKSKVLCRLLSISLFAFFNLPNANGQDYLDTWFMAGRAVNSPSAEIGKLHQMFPLPPADGTFVDKWYDFADFAVDPFAKTLR